MGIPPRAAAVQWSRTAPISILRRNTRPGEGQEENTRPGEGHYPGFQELYCELDDRIGCSRPLVLRDGGTECHGCVKDGCCYTLARISLFRENWYGNATLAPISIVIGCSGCPAALDCFLSCFRLFLINLDAQIVSEVPIWIICRHLNDPSEHSTEWWGNGERVAMIIFNQTRAQKVHWVLASPPIL